MVMAAGGGGGVSFCFRAGAADVCGTFRGRLSRRTTGRMQHVFSLMRPVPHNLRDIPDLAVVLRVRQTYLAVGPSAGGAQPDAYGQRAATCARPRGRRARKSRTSRLAGRAASMPPGRPSLSICPGKCSYTFSAFGLPDPSSPCQSVPFRRWMWEGMLPFVEFGAAYRRVPPCTS